MVNEIQRFVNWLRRRRRRNPQAPTPVPPNLVNAGCRITTIQALLGHRRLNATMVYARVHDRTVAEDYYAAMAIIERRLTPYRQQEPEQKDTQNSHNQLENAVNGHHLLALVDNLQAENLDEKQHQLLTELRRGLLALTGQTVAV